MIRYVGIALLAAAATAVLAEAKSPLSKYIPIGAILLLFAAAITEIVPIITEFSSLLEDNSSSVYTSTLLRALGIAYATELTGDICRASGAEAAAVGISVIGRAELTIIAAGFLFELLKLAASLLL